MRDYDLIVIGAGPGGYVAAERAGAAGKKVLLIEREELGGVCLNWGCIPTKTLLACAKLFYQASHGESFGVLAEPVFDLGRAMQRKTAVQQKLRAGIKGLMRRHRVEVVSGVARLQSPTEVVVGDTVFRSPRIIIATGSRPARPPIPGVDGAQVVDSSGILAIEALPQRLCIIGGGVIGLEFACVFASVGVPVTVIEMLPQIGGPLDADCAKILQRSLAAKGVVFHLGARVEAIEADAVRFTAADGSSQQAAADLVLLSTGRRANVENLGLEECGVALGRGGIIIDSQCRTNVPGISAIGDCTGILMLAHVASRQAEVAVATMLGTPDQMRYHAVPGVIYTSPEVAFCGLSEAAAAEQQLEVQVLKWPFAANGRFLAESDEDGLAKVVVCAQSRRLLGVHLVGPQVSEMIHSAAIAIETEQRVDELKEIIFPHPTISEAVRDSLFQFH